MPTNDDRPAPAFNPARVYVADELDENGTYPLFHVGPSGITDELGCIFEEWIVEVRHALAVLRSAARG